MKQPDPFEAIVHLATSLILDEQAQRMRREIERAEGRLSRAIEWRVSRSHPYAGRNLNARVRRARALMRARDHEIRCAIKLQRVCENVELVVCAAESAAVKALHEQRKLLADVDAFERAMGYRTVLDVTHLSDAVVFSLSCGHAQWIPLMEGPHERRVICRKCFEKLQSPTRRE